MTVLYKYTTIVRVSWSKNIKVLLLAALFCVRVYSLSRPGLKLLVLNYSHFYSVSVRVYPLSALV